MTKFSKKQIQDWKAYESVRAVGLYNMFDSRARALTGLNRDDYFFVMKNFSELKEQASK